MLVLAKPQCSANDNRIVLLRSMPGAMETEQEDEGQEELQGTVALKTQPLPYLELVCAASRSPCCNGTRLPDPPPIWCRWQPRAR